MNDPLDAIKTAANEIIENGCEIERWDDPGDYPSGAGGGPLSSYDYLLPPEEVEVVVACSEESEWLVGEIWTLLASSGDVEAELRCKIAKVSQIGPAELAVLVKVGDR